MDLQAAIPPRGEPVDIGGRTLRVVRAGPPGASPLVVLEHGAFGCATDWAVVQERLAAKGFRSLAYDRAGLGWSQPGPPPRDGRALNADLEALLQALGERGPLVLVGHSMGGLMVRMFAIRHPQRVRGVVLVDAVVPEILQMRGGAAAVRAFWRLLRLARVAARFGLMRPVAALTHNLIGLAPEAAADKRRIHGSPAHAHWSTEEVGAWPATSAMAAEAEFPPGLPIAVITAGAERAAPALKALQAIPAMASRRGYVEHVAGARHASLLGQRFADPIVRGVEHVARG